MKWFEVDKVGLSKLLERRGKQFALYELIQNAWDENTTRVDVTLSRTPASRFVTIEVEDDNPTGFADLSHAFTLFAESAKKDDAEKRGRFNLGDKLVLALCDFATISTTTGTIIFDEKGRRRGNSKRVRGSKFGGDMRMTLDEQVACAEAVRALIPPVHIDTYFNGEQLPARVPLETMHVSLPTEVADLDGVLRRSVRHTFVEVFEPLPGEEPALYEMGIPVVVTGDRWHVNVGQKIPLNMDRDNVTPAYLGQVRALVAERMADRLTTADANATWVRDAFERHGDDFAPETVDRLTTLRFGEKRVAYDPSDPEANALAVVKGFTVVHGGQLSKAEWEAARRTNAILPAGQVTPSPKPFAEGGDELKMLDEAKWTPGIRAFKSLAHKLAVRLLNTGVEVEIANDFGWHFLGCYGNRRLIVNVARAGYDWFDGPLAPMLAFLIHEFAHHYCGNHLDEKYHDALECLGGNMAQLALDDPKVFRRKLSVPLNKVLGPEVAS